MPLPSSGQMTMNAVKAEFSSSQSANLSLTGFGAALGTPVTSNIALAASFYGQSNAVSVTSWLFRSNGGDVWEEVEQACESMAEGEYTTITLYHDGSGTFPADGDKVYTNNPGTSFAGNGVYGYIENKNPTTFSISGGAGLVGETEVC